MNETEAKGLIALEVAGSIRMAINSVKESHPGVQIVFDGCIEIDGILFYKPDWTKALRFPSVERIGLSCPDCGVPLMACNPPTIGQCSECATIWELPKTPEYKENE